MGKQKCYYYKCDTHMYKDEREKHGISLFNLPSPIHSIERHKQYLIRMNIASYESKIPGTITLRICSKHFKEEDMNTNLKRKKLRHNALPIDWKDIFPKEEVELIEGRTSFRPGDDILEYIEEQRAYKGGMPRIEHNYSKELDPNLIPSVVTRTAVELVRYVSTRHENLLCLINAHGPRHKLTKRRKAALKAISSADTSKINLPHVDEEVEIEVMECDVETELDLPGDDRNEEMVIPKEKVCRTCGREEENLVGIYENHGRSIFLAEKMNSVLPIKISEKDELPLQVCLVCIDQIEAASKLFTKVSDVHQTLKKWYKVSDEVDVLQSIMDDIGIGPDDGFDTGADHHITEEGNEETEKPLEPDVNDINVSELVNEVDFESDVKAYENALEASKDPLSEPHYNQLICSTCNIVFGKIEEYLEHNEENHGRVLLHCPLCFVFFNSMKLMYEHWKSLHSKILRALKVKPVNETLQLLEAKRQNKRWLCKYCKVDFDNKIIYREHMKMEWKKIREGRAVLGTLKCDYCNEKFVTDPQRIRHMLSTHNEYTPYHCSYCRKRFKVKQCWKDHEATHVGDTNFLCNICGKIFKARNFLRLHMRSHQKHVQCKVCSRSMNPDRIKAHMLGHAQNTETKLRHGFQSGVPLRTSNIDTKAIKCAVEGCTSYYSDLKELHRHCDQFHSGFKAPQRPIEPGTDGFLCSYCDEIFAKPEAYKFHIKKNKHAENPIFTCQICRFNTQIFNDLLKHLETHSECQRYTCQECPKKFSTADRRFKHEFVHMQKPKECPHCKKMVKGLVFQDHLNLHTGEKPYGCTTCGQVFASKKNWTAHLATHSNSMPFTCEICDQSFRTNHMLTVHTRVHTANKTYNCKFCEFASLTRTTVQIHMIREHSLNGALDGEEQIS